MRIFFWNYFVEIKGYINRDNREKNKTIRKEIQPFFSYNKKFKSGANFFCDLYHFQFVTFDQTYQQWRQ